MCKKYRYFYYEQYILKNQTKNDSGCEKYILYNK